LKNKIKFQRAGFIRHEIGQTTRRPTRVQAPEEMWISCGFPVSGLSSLTIIAKKQFK
jgi:hypothetical protein